MSARRSLRAVAAALASSACLFAAGPAGATAAVLLPRGTDAHVERHDVVFVLQASGSVTWDAIDVAGSPSDIGVLVAMKAGGRIEVTARAWADAVDEATKVVVTPLPDGVECKALSVTPGVSVGGDASASGTASGSGSANAESNGGCGKSSSNESHTDGGGSGGGCLTSSTESGGGGCTSCSRSSGGGCGGCEPSSSGHPGCSAIHETTTGCSPASDDGGAGGTSPEGGPGTGTTVGPYEIVRVGAADGTARRWIDELGFDVPASFDAAAAELEREGYELHVLHARAPASSTVVRSFRIVTAAPDAKLPLRLLRMGSGADQAPTPVTLMTLATAPLALANQSVATIDESHLGTSGTSSNYETLVANALGSPTSPQDDAGVDGGTDSGADGGGPGATRWVLESARSLVLRPADDGGTATLGGLFQAKCSQKAAQQHLVCSALSGPSASPSDGGFADAGGGSDAGDAGSATDAGEPDAATTGDAGGAEGGTTSDAGTDCSATSRESCDDLDLALAASATVATRFRGSIADDARALADLELTPAPGSFREGRFFVRPNGVPGTCEPPPGGVSAGAEAEASKSCASAAARLRFDAGPLAMLLGVVYALRRMLRRSRR